MFYYQVYKTKNPKNKTIRDKLINICLEIAFTAFAYLFIFIVSLLKGGSIFLYISEDSLFWSAFIIFAVCAGSYILNKKQTERTALKIVALVCVFLALIVFSIYLIIIFDVVSGAELTVFYISITCFIVAELCNFFLAIF